MEYFILIYCQGRRDSRLEEAEASLQVMFNQISKKEMVM